MGGKWSTLEALAGASDRLDVLARLIVEHFEKRREAIEGKGMIVCMSRRICVELHDPLSRSFYARADACMKEK